jgi:hypothetical protein
MESKKAWLEQTPDLAETAYSSRTKSKIIFGEVLTTNAIDDAQVVEELLEQSPGNVAKFAGDGAYDKVKVYDALSEKKIKPLIPPRKNARIRKHGNSKGGTLKRDNNIRMIRRHGRAKWKKKIKYHQRSIAETTMFRYKTIIGEKLKSRTMDRQTTEIKIGCKILNIMAGIGLPKSIKIRAA